MDNIFGLPMATVAVVVAGLMGACLIVSILIAFRNRIIFKMAMRNIPRRKAQTVLISLGLMLSTLIVAASLTTGDTLNYSVTKSTYDNLGRVDETIAYVGDRTSKGDVSVDNQPIAASIAAELSQRLAGDPNVAAVMPVLTFGVPFVDTATRLNESQVVLTGLDASKLDAFGGLKTASGTPIDFASLRDGSSVISQTLADELGAHTGDRLTFNFNNQPENLTVGAIASDSILTGYGANTSGSGPAAATTPSMLGVAVPLAWLQEITGFQGKARFLAVANSGGVESGASRTDAAEASLQSALTQIDGGSTLGVNPIKQDAVNSAESIASLFTTFFIVMGLFSIVSGILLIFVIFTMLASERRSDMGMARAVGMTRSQLIQGFIAEGTGYDLGAALIGAAAGVLVALAMVRALGALVGGSLAIEPHVTLRSLFIAYALGVSVTFLTIVFAAVRASRVNIVAAIRDLPDQAQVESVEPVRWRWWSSLPRFGPRFGFALVTLVWLPFEFIWNVLLIAPKLLAWVARRLAQRIGWGPVISLAGASFVALGISAKNVYAFATGLSILVLGLSLFGRRYLPSRLVFSVGAALMLAYWLLPSSVSGRVLPNVGTGGPAMFFLSGIFMVFYMTLIIMWNADLILWFVSLFARIFARWLPAIKTAVAYPLASRGRTGMTVAMFSIVVFSLVMVKTINVNFLELLLSNEASAGWDVKVTANSANPIVDLRSRLAGTDVELSNVDAIGKISSITPTTSMIRNSGSSTWARDSINGMDSNFLEHAKIPLQARAPGYASDAAVWQALSSGTNVAIIDSNAISGGGFGGSTDQYRAPGGTTVSDDTFRPFSVQLLDAQSGKSETVTVIGIIDPKVSTLSGLYLSQAMFNRLYPSSDQSQFYLRLSDNSTENATAMAKSIEASLASSGVQAVSIQDQLAAEDSFSSGFFALLGGFMALGLLVGIASLGVISFRSVVERRQQIGMLRAIGYQRGMVAASFLLESIVIATLGVGSGVVLAVVLSHNLITGGSIGGGQFTHFVIPWSTIALIVFATVLSAGLLTWIPARKAASVPIADALRYE